VNGIEKPIDENEIENDGTGEKGDGKEDSNKETFREFVDTVMACMGMCSSELAVESMPNADRYLVLHGHILAMM